MNMLLRFLAAAPLVFTAIDAQANVNPKDVQVAARTLGFLANKPSGTVTVAVVYAPDQPESRKDAENLQAILGAGLSTSGITLVPVLTPVDKLADLDSAGLVFVTSGLAAQHGAIFEATKARKLLSVSTDASCVQSGKCVMAVKAEPKVEIVINKTAAEASQVAFQPSFRMMISEI